MRALADALMGGARGPTRRGPAGVIPGGDGRESCLRESAVRRAHARGAALGFDGSFKERSLPDHFRCASPACQGVARRGYRGAGGQVAGALPCH